MTDIFRTTIDHGMLMRRRLKYWLPFVGMAFACLVSFFVVETSETFHECVERAQYKAAQTTPPKQVADVPFTFPMRRGCWGHYVEKNADGIIALFTILLAGSTIGLWFAKASAAEAARAAAEHILRIERAYIVGGGPTRPINRTGELLDPLDVGWVSIGNYGKTAAILKKVEWGFADESLFPSHRPVSDLLNQGLILAELINTLSKEDVLRPGEPPYALAGTSFSIGSNDGKVFFGRFTYGILFDDQEHFSTFKLKLSTGGESYGLPGSYQDWN